MRTFSRHLIEFPCPLKYFIFPGLLQLLFRSCAFHRK
uniref:Uncharacterized protein n=1 Tax=Arundo donax TaxID=35708 RepID=A0A0A9HBS5_ARUDO